MVVQGNFQIASPPACEYGDGLRASTIMIVDPSRTNRLVLKTIAERFGYTTVLAEDGIAAVEVFAREQPDLILMEISLPGMSGYEAAPRLKQAAGERFVPIIFITAQTSTSALVKCIQAGGDDFITKPYDSEVIKAKIDAMERIRQLHARLREQNDALAGFHRGTRRELQIAEYVFSTILNRGVLDAPFLNHWIAPMSLFNGDLLLCDYTPSGGVHVMLGDFTGHGLSAAIGAIPVADIFYSMTAKGFSIGDIAGELNDKLNSILPVDMFCAACLIELDAERTVMGVWNGGMPDVYLTDGAGKRQCFPSKHAPLGVMRGDCFDRQTEIVAIDDTSRIFLLSDGVTEARNAAGEKFGRQRLEACFMADAGSNEAFAGIIAAVDRFTEGVPQNDDISLVEIVAARHLGQWRADQQETSKNPITPSTWRLDLHLQADALRETNPVPLLLNLVMQMQEPSGHRERIFTVLSELFSNALDHGLLGLDSAIKDSAEGFMGYYQERTRRLAGLDEGWIHLRIKHLPEEGGGMIEIHVQDSGDGFDVKNTISSLESNQGYARRGIALIKTLCETLEYNDLGNQATARYHWRRH